MAIVDPVIVDVDRKLREIIDALDHKLSAADNLAGEGTTGHVLTSRGEGLSPVYAAVPVAVAEESPLSGNIAYLDRASQVFRNEVAFDENLRTDVINEYGGGVGVTVDSVLLKDGNVKVQGVAPEVSWSETDQVLPLGLWRARLDADELHVERNTAVAGDFSPFAEVMKIAALLLTLLVPTTTNSQISSTVTTGTAPFVVASTTLVANLNADLLDGQTGAFYQDASNLNAGVAARARLPAALAYEDEANTFTLLNTFGAGLAVSAGGINVTGTSTFNGAAVSMGALTAARLTTNGTGDLWIKRDLTDFAGRRNWGWSNEQTTVGDLQLLVSTTNTGNPVTRVAVWESSGAVSFQGNAVSMGPLTATTVDSSGRVRITANNVAYEWTDSTGNIVQLLPSFGGDDNVYFGRLLGGTRGIQGYTFLGAGGTDLAHLGAGSWRPANSGQLTLGTDLLPWKNPRFGFDASNRLDITISSIGGVTYDAVGTGALHTFSDDLTIGSLGRFDSTDTPTDNQFLKWTTAVGKWQAFSLVSGDLPAHTHAEADITDGTILARLAAAETISGAWTFDNTLTMAATRLLLTAASAAGGAGFRLPHGAAPTTPVDGDTWTTTAGLFARVSGVTKGPFIDSANIALDDLSDVVITTPASGHFIRYNGTNWVNTLLVAGDIAVHTHAAADITSGNLAYARMPTGAGSWDTGASTVITVTRSLTIGEITRSQGRLVLDHGSSTDTGTQNAWAAPTTPVRRWAGAGGANMTLNGIAAPSDGGAFWLINSGTAAGGAPSISVVHQSGSASAADRIVLPNEAGMTIIVGEGAFFWYDTTDSRWRVLAMSVVGS